MTIGIDASRANNEQKTGVEWYAFFLIEELKKIVPADVQVMLYSEKPLQGELAQLPANWSSKVLRWPPKRFWTQIRLSYEMLFHAPDVLFVPAHVFPLIHPKKTVMTVHDVAATRFREVYNWFERWYSLWSAKYAVKNLWKVIVPSIFTKVELQTLAQGSENVSVVYHGFDHSYFEKKSEEQVADVLKKYTIEKPFLLFTGRIEEKKNTLRIVHAFEGLKPQYLDLKLVLVGKPGLGFEKIQAAIENSPYKKDIIQPGYVEQADIFALFQGAKVFVFPSLYEGFGIPILEAFASEVPVVTSNTTSNVEIARTAAVTVDPLQTEDIKNGIEKLLESDALMQDYIAKGKIRAQEFSWKKCAQETLQILLS